MMFFKRNTLQPESEHSQKAANDVSSLQMQALPDGERPADRPILSPSSPFLWPETRALNCTHRYGAVPVFATESAGTRTIFGIIHNLTEHGVHWICDQLRGNERLTICLLVTVYPACSTSSKSLQSLLELLRSNESRLKVRLKPTQRGEDRVTTYLCIVAESGASQMVISPSGDFALGQRPSEFLHLCFSTDTALHHQFTSWFDFQWATGNPLNETSVQLPDLVPATGDPEADRKWQTYLSKLDAKHLKKSGESTIAVDSETGDLVDSDGNRIVSVLDAAKVPRPTIAMVQVGKVLHKGSLATIDNSSRVGPLDCPISAELFGIDADRRTGTVSREIKFRVSAIDDKTLKKLESFRKRTRELLNKMSYPLADGARWVPQTARTLLEQELERVNQEGQALLGETIGRDVEKFVEHKRLQVASDAQSQFAELHPGEKMPENAVDRILAELTNRLTRATGGKLLPMLSFLDVRIATAPDSDWSTQASQAYRFLLHVAKYPRNCLTDPFFMRGLRIGQKDLMVAMNVVDDALINVFATDGSGIDLAKDQNRIIEIIQSAKVDDIIKCDSLYRLMRGADEIEINKILSGLVSHSSPTDAPSIATSGRRPILR